MAEIDSLGTNYYYSGAQSSTNEALKKQKKSEKSGAVRKSRFSDLLKSDKTEDEAEAISKGLPPEIAGMSIEDAAIFLKDAVDNAGNDLSENLSKENIEKFKTSVRQFVTFVVNNNFNIDIIQRRFRPGKKIPPSRLFYFSDYTVKPKVNPRVSIEIINKKLDELTRETLSMQMDNLKILAKANEIKGLIIDLMSS